MLDIDWRRLPALTTLRAFEATARLGGYSAAARALNVTPAAIAQQVRKLEADIGAALVRREGRGLALTEAGERFAVPLRDAFALIAKGYDDVRLQEATRGVRVSMTDYFGDAVILPRLGSFWKRHPAVPVSFSPDGNARPVDLDAFDVVVRGAPRGHVWEGCAQVTLLESPMAVCGAPSLIGSGPPDLGALPWLQDRSLGQPVFRRIVEGAGADPETIRIVDPGSARFELEAGLMGYGLIAGPEITVRKHLAEGSLVRVDRGVGMTAVYYALTRTAALAPPARLFLDWLVEICMPLSAKGHGNAGTGDAYSP